MWQDGSLNFLFSGIIAVICGGMSPLLLELRPLAWQVIGTGEQEGQPDHPT